MSMNLNGKPVFAVGVAQAATSATVLTWVDINGNTYTPAVGDRFNFVDIIVANVATAKNVRIFQDHDSDNAIDAGEDLIAPIEFSGQGTAVVPLGMDRPSRKLAAATNDFMILASTTGNINWYIAAHVTRT